MNVQIINYLTYFNLCAVFSYNLYDFWQFFFYSSRRTIPARAVNHASLRYCFLLFITQIMHLYYIKAPTYIFINNSINIY